MTLTNWLTVVAMFVPLTLFLATLRATDRAKIDKAIQDEKGERVLALAALRMQIEASADMIAANKLHVAESYVSRESLTASLTGLLREMETGFRNLDAKMDLLFDRAPKSRSRAGA